MGTRDTDEDSKYAQFNQDLKEIELELLESLPDIVWCFVHPYRTAVWFDGDDLESAMCSLCHWSAEHSIGIKHRIKMTRRKPVKMVSVVWRIEESLVTRLQIAADEADAKPSGLVRKLLDENLYKPKKQVKAVKAAQPQSDKCEFCDGELKVNKRGPVKRFCSSICRTRAWVGTRGAEVYGKRVKSKGD